MKATLCLFFLIFAVKTFANESDESQVTQAKKFAPTREHSIIVTQEGYFPENIAVFEGETLRIFVSTTEDKISCLMMPTHNLFLSATPGKITSGEVKFDEIGDYEYYCPDHKIKGKVTVLERQSFKQKKMRSPAAVTKSKVWMPKDF